jgi:DNA-binding IscR family transcriptional regulator
VLGRSAHGITLLDIYRAVEERDLIRIHDVSDTPCPIGRKIHGILVNYCDHAEEAMAKYLRGVTLSEIVDRVESPPKTGAR